MLDAKKETLLAVIRAHVDLDSTIQTDGWRDYDGLVDVGYDKHCRFHRGENEFAARGGRYINVIESFWAYAKLRLSRFRVYPSMHFICI